MKAKTYIFIVSIISLFGIIFYINTINSQRHIIAMKKFLTMLFTVQKYENIEDIIHENNDKNIMLTVLSVWDYHVDYKSIQNSMVEKEFNYLVVNRFITLCPKISNKLNSPATIENIILTPKNEDIYYFEVFLRIGSLRGPIKGEISVKKLEGEWIATYIY